MKCPVCGAINEDFMEYCENCAAPLSQSGSNSRPTRVGGATGTRTSWGFAKSPQWPQPEFDADTISENDIPGEFVSRFDHDTSNSNVGASEPVSEKPYIPHTQADVSHTAPRRSVRHDENADYDNETPQVNYAEPVDKDTFYHYDEKQKTRPQRQGQGHNRPAVRSAGRSSRGMNQKTLLFYAAAGALIVIIIVLAIIFLTKGNSADQVPPADNTTVSDVKQPSAFSMFFDSLFGKSPLTKPATIVKDVTNTGEPAYTVTVYAKRNCTVRFTAGTFVSDNLVDDGSVGLRIPERVWIPGEPVDGEVLEITPDVVVIDKDGNETQVQFGEKISITLPTIGLNVTAPAEDSFSVNAAAVAISGVVDDNTAEVYAGDTPLSVDANGNFTGTYTLPGVGTQTLNIEARKNGYAIARKTFTIEYATDVAGTGAGTGTGASGTGVTGTPAFNFAADQTRRVTEASLTVKGTIEAGATLTVSGAELNGAVSIDSAAGTFQFTVNMPDVKLYTVEVASTKGGATGTRTIYLERSHADKTKYMEDAHALDYQYLKDSPHHKQSYAIVGKVAEVVQSSPYQLVRLTTDKGDIMFAYYSGITTIDPSDGMTYTVYADPYGRYEETGVPLVYAWYIKKS
ncbi:MAG: hypothetical protein RR232_02065 [Clostridia bacterium]